MRYSRVFSATMACAAFMGMVAVTHPVRGEAGDSPTSPIVARVNGTSITAGELDREAERLLRREAASPDSRRVWEIRRRALDVLIDQELLWQESRREGITVPEGDVMRELAALGKSVPSTAALEKALDEMDISPETVRREVERRMAVAALLERRLGNGAHPSDEEVRRFYDTHTDTFRIPEKVRISHILVRIEPRWQREKKEEARFRMAGIRQRLRSGEPFSALAKEFSDCPSAEKGGDLGWFSRGSLTPQLEVAVFSLPAMVVSDILEDRYGFHLVLVTGRKPPRRVTFAEARPQVVRYLRDLRLREEGMHLARQLRRSAALEIVRVPLR